MKRYLTIMGLSLLFFAFFPFSLFVFMLAYFFMIDDIEKEVKRENIKH